MPQIPRSLNVNGTSIAFHHTTGQGVGVMFLGGFKSDMEGSKALFLEARCKEANIPFTRFDYGGHGISGGTFEEGSIGLWLSHAKAVFDAVAGEQTILIGSSMGGWMMLLLALARKAQVAGLVGIASAPDFTENLIWQAFSEAQRSEMAHTGKVMIPNCYPGEEAYPITRTLIEEGRNHLLLNAPIALSCPITLLHGMKDEDVPYGVSLQLAEKLESADVRIVLDKAANHRFSEPENLERLWLETRILREKLG